MKRAFPFAFAFTLLALAGGVMAAGATDTLETVNSPALPDPAAELAEGDLACEDPTAETASGENASQEAEFSTVELGQEPALWQSGGGTSCEGTCGGVKIQFTCDFGSSAAACCEKTIENAPCPPGSEFHGFCQDQQQEIVCP